MILDAAWNVVKARHSQLRFQQDLASLHVPTDLHIKQQSIAHTIAKRTEHTTQ